MTYPTSRSPANDHWQTSPFSGLLYSGHDTFGYPEHGPPMNLPDSQISHPIYHGAGTLDVLGSPFGFHGSASEHHDTAFEYPDTQFIGMIHPSSFNGSIQDGIVNDRRIVPIPGRPSPPYLSVHDENMRAGRQMPHQLQNNFELYQRLYSSQEFVDTNPSNVPSSNDYTRVSRARDDYQLSGFGYGSNRNIFDRPAVPPSSALGHERATKHPSVEPYHEDNSFVQASPVIWPGAGVLESSPGCSVSAKSSRGNRSNTRFREQADAAGISRIESIPRRRRHTSSSSLKSCSSTSSHSVGSDDQCQGGDGTDTVPSLPHIKERARFPGREYKCLWGSCKKTFVANPLEGEHTTTTQERFQDDIEEHIENHIWISACGKRGTGWPCRWSGCDGVLTTKRALIRHVGAHSGFRVTCECGSSYSRFDAFKRHQSKCGGTK